MDTDEVVVCEAVELSAPRADGFKSIDTQPINQEEQ